MTAMVQLATGEQIEIDMAKYPTMAQVRLCLENGGHISLLYENSKKKASLVWSLYRSQPMRPSMIQKLESSGVIVETDYRHGRNKWGGDWSMYVFTSSAENSPER